MPGETDTASQGAAGLLVVILNFNGIEDTLACLESLETQTCRDFHVLVIDNASEADDLGRIAARFPAVEITLLPENRGWAGGNNVGLRLGLERGYHHVCLLNNDTILDPSAIEALLAASAAIGSACLLHPAIAFFDDPTEWQLHPEPRPGQDSAPGGLQAAHDIVRMDWAYGACLVLPAATIEQVGLLDERFFLQLEETDYFRRAKALGIGSFCALRARILHKESASFGGRITANKTYYQVRNSLLLAEKHTPTPFGFARTIRGLLWTLHHQTGLTRLPALTRWLCSSDPMARAVRQGVRDYLRRRFGPRPAAR